MTTMSSTNGRHRAATRALPPRKRLDPISVLGELLVTFGVLCLLFGFWEVVWTNVQSGREQNVVAQQLEDQWRDKNPRPLTEPPEGAAFARLYIPAFGSDFNFSVVKGVKDEDLDRGPGHYLDSQLPGEPGNFAMAGHRVGRGSPFNDLGLLKTCDSVVVETAGSWDIYRVLPIDVPPDQRQAALSKCMSGKLASRMSQGEYAQVNGRYITTPNDVEVINPIPHKPRVEVKAGDASLLTMTTCHPQYSNTERMIVHAVKVRTDDKKPGFVPAELTKEV